MQFQFRISIINTMFEVLWVLSIATLSSTFKNSASPKKELRFCLFLFLCILWLQALHVKGTEERFIRFTLTIDNSKYIFVERLKLA